MQSEEGLLQPSHLGDQTLRGAGGLLVASFQHVTELGCGELPGLGQDCAPPAGLTRFLEPEAIGARTAGPGGLQRATEESPPAPGARSEGTSVPPAAQDTGHAPCSGSSTWQSNPETRTRGPERCGASLGASVTGEPGCPQARLSAGRWSWGWGCCTEGRTGA